MDEFPGNSNKEKRTRESRVDKVIEGTVVRRKTPLGTRFRNAFLGGEDIQSVAGYVFHDVLLPAAKDMFVDAMNLGTERMVFGEARSSSGRSRHSRGRSEKEDYGRYSKETRRDEPRGMTRKARANHDFDELIIPSRPEADVIIDKMYAILEKYEVVTVGDFYEMCGEPADWTDDDWGWTDLRGTSSTRLNGGGYLINLPRPEPLEKR